MARAEPASYGTINVLYTMHMFFAFVSRMWEIGIVLLVAELTGNSLFIVALAGLMSSSTVFLFSPSVGAWFDDNDRLYAMKLALLVKVVSVSTGYALCAHLLGLNDVSAIVDGYEIYAVPLVCALANLSFAMVTMSIEKDWVVVLSGGNRDWLSSTNAMMTQIDLSCNAVAPAVTGILFSVFSYRAVALVLLTLNAVTTMGLYIFLNRLYDSWPALMRRKGNTGIILEADIIAVVTEPLAEADMLADGVTSPPPSPQQTPSDSRHPLPPSGSTPSFIESGVAGTMFAYSCLYFTVLSFSSLMLVYLKWSGLEDHWIGVARGVAAVSGFLGAAIYPYARGILGLVLSGQIFIWWQCCLVGGAATAIVVTNSTSAVKIMVGCVLVSRIGLWAFDLCARQIAQEGVPEAHRGAINGKWRSLTAFFDLSSYLVAVMFPDPADFWILASTSAVMVFIAAITFTISTASCCYRSDGYSPVNDKVKFNLLV